MLAFDSNLAPIVGQQITLTARNGAAAEPRLELLVQRAAADECELVARVLRGGRELGLLYLPDGGGFASDRAGEAPFTLDQLRVLARRTPVTFTAVPSGSGERIALDRDSDGVLDGDE